jgi:hypothetical protein
MVDQQSIGVAVAGKSDRLPRSDRDDLHLDARVDREQR